VYLLQDKSVLIARQKCTYHCFFIILSMPYMCLKIKKLKN